MWVSLAKIKVRAGLHFLWEALVGNLFPRLFQLQEASPTPGLAVPLFPIFKANEVTSFRLFCSSPCPRGGKGVLT